jgi:hypothetical protein
MARASDEDTATLLDDILQLMRWWGAAGWADKCAQRYYACSGCRAEGRSNSVTAADFTGAQRRAGRTRKTASQLQC